MRTPVFRLHSDPCFEHKHARRTLIEVGRKDALAHKDEIEVFFLDRSDTSVHPAGSSPHNHAVLPRIGTAAGVLARSAGAL